MVGEFHHPHHCDPSQGLPRGACLLGCTVGTPSAEGPGERASPGTAFSTAVGFGCGDPCAPLSCITPQEGWDMGLGRALQGRLAASLVTGGRGSGGSAALQKVTFGRRRAWAHLTFESHQ